MMIINWTRGALSHFAYGDMVVVWLAGGEIASGAMMATVSMVPALAGSVEVEDL